MRYNQPRRAYWYENLELKTDKELTQLRDSLCMKADDEMSSILNDENEDYDESDLEFWDKLIDQISAILRERKGL